jgi:lincosamide nucleotidyltransferase A/C/D/E
MTIPAARRPDNDPPDNSPSRFAVVTGHLYRFLKSHRPFDVIAVGISRRVRESSPSSRLNMVLGPLRAHFRGEMKADDVIQVVDALEAAGVRFWIAGGWGVDLLVGSPTRRHDDLDVVLSDFEGDQARAGDALEPLGYHLVEVLDGLWMTPRNLLDDGFGHQIEVLGIDRARLDTALGSTGGGSEQSRVEDRAPELFAVGTLLGRRVPCLSAQLQLLFHSGFDARGVDEGDMALLRARSHGKKGSTPR